MKEKDEEKNQIDYLRGLFENKGYSREQQRVLVNALREILEEGGVFTLGLVNFGLSFRRLPLIDSEILEAFLDILVKEFRYTVDTHTVH